MTKYLLITLLIFQVYFPAAQEKFTLWGFVKDKETGEPLIGANVWLANTNIGVFTDVHGFYSLEVYNTQNIEVNASFVGYKLHQEKISAQKNTQHTIFLIPGMGIGEVEVKANNPMNKITKVGVMEIPVKMVKNLPMFGEYDVLKAMQLLPGIQGGSDGRSGLYVRGGSPDQNLFMLDGTPLYYVNHLGGFVSVFHPDILKNIKLYKGGFPSRFGGRLSSIIDLRLKEGNKKKLHGSYGVGIVSGDFTLEGPIVKDRTSFIVSLRRVWVDFLLRPSTKIGLKYASMGYNFYDIYGKISHDINSKNKLYLSFYGGDDRLGFFYNNKGEKIKNNTKYIWGNILATSRWHHVYSSKIYSDITLFYTRYRYKNNTRYRSNNSEGYNLYSTGVNDLGFKTDFSWHIKNNLIRFGGGISYNWFNPGLIRYKSIENIETNKTVIGVSNKDNATNTFVYAESDYNPNPWLKLNIGFRATNYQTQGTNFFSAEPRISFSLNTNKIGVLKFGYSEMVQPVHMLTYSGSVFPTDIWLPSSPEIAPAKSKQLSVGFSKKIKEQGIIISLEGYNKKLKNLIEVKGGVPLVNTQSWDENVEKEGIGTSKGIELFIKKETGKSKGWLSYTLSKSDRQFMNINNGIPYVFKYDRKHDISIVLSHSISEKIDVSATWLYGSGYPTTLHHGVYQTIIPHGWSSSTISNEPFEMRGEAYIYPGKNWLKMRDYHKLDIGVNLRKKKKNKKGNNILRTWTLGIYNIYNRQNPVYYYYDYKNQHNKSPIVIFQQSGFPFFPTLKYSITF